MPPYHSRVNLAGCLVQNLIKLLVRLLVLSLDYRILDPKTYQSLAANKLTYTQSPRGGMTNGEPDFAR